LLTSSLPGRQIARAGTSINYETVWHGVAPERSLVGAIRGARR
jgi:hypothetical protein